MTYRHDRYDQHGRPQESSTADGKKEKLPGRQAMPLSAGRHSDGMTEHSWQQDVSGTRRVSYDDRERDAGLCRHAEQAAVTVSEFARPQ